MDIKKINNLVSFIYNDENLELSAGQEQEFEEYLQEHSENIYARIFFEYTQLDIGDRKAKQFLDQVLKNRQELQQGLGREIDFRVAFLDYLVRNLHTIRQASEPRIIEDKILRNLNRLIVKDELTGLYNFRHYEIELEKEFSRSLRNGNKFSLVIIDIDDFKRYNDSFGHMEGNRVLKKLGALILKTERKIDIACRYGGEEFALILPQTDSRGAFVLVDRLRLLIEQIKFKRIVTISGGVATFPVDTVKTDRSLFECADKALYYSKEMGKNQITLYSEVVEEEVLV